MENAATPGLLKYIQVLNHTKNPIFNLLGQFEPWDKTQPPPENLQMKSLSKLTEADMKALGPFNLYSVPSRCFRGIELDHKGTNIIQAILDSQPPAMQQLAVPNEVLQKLQTDLSKGKTHSMTFNESEMTRRTVVDAVLSAAVALAETAWDFLVLNGEEINLSTKPNKGVTFVVEDKTCLLCGPIDYVVTGLNSKLVVRNLLEQHGAEDPLPSHLQAAIQGTNHTVCPIEAKVSIVTISSNYHQTLRQVIGESLVLCKARYGNLTTPFPFVLCDGDSWFFGILLGETIFMVGLTWGGADHDELDILRALVIWTCSQPQQIWNAMWHAYTPTTSALYGKDTIG
ncbi:hypothetical protein B0H16DRAFT_1811654 [Mycena metata]|uniref:Uncharacterized protein n=1 Tax=Mycena metata TaxID=1033252 RepID=A0AAD7MEN3_9AGAR|nr:hypothetical protein B0H16DRAFT_1811654 [Mycena metata]